MISGEQLGTADDVFPFPATWLSADQVLYTGNGKLLTTTLSTEATRSIPFQAKFELNRPDDKRLTSDFQSSTAHTGKGILSPALSPDGKHGVFKALHQTRRR